MAVHKVMIDLMKMFTKLSVSPDQAVINDLDNVTQEQLERNNKLLFVEYTSDVYSTTPSCMCGYRAKEYWLGRECPKCNTLVQDKVQQQLQPQLWMRAPKGVAQFINPIAWILLKDFLSVDKGPNAFDVLLWLTTTDTQNKKHEALQADILALGIERGYNYFVANFNAVTNKLFTLPVYNKPEKRVAKARLITVFNQYRDCVFTEMLPVINRNMIVMESEAAWRYIDKSAPMGVNAVRLLLGIDTPGSHLRQSARENRTAKMLSKLTEFYIDYFKTNYAAKRGLIRKHMCATRTAFSARAVISSLTKPHSSEELYFPWGPSIGLMRQHLMNRLTSYGMPPQMVFAYLSCCVDTYHRLAGKILDDMLKESPTGRIVGTFCRNPSLHRGSIQLMGISKFKKDPSDRTIQLPITNVSTFNADFDGDEMAFVMGGDEEMVMQLEPLKPHKNVFDLSRYRELSGNISITKPVSAMWSSALESGPRKAPTAAMAKFAV